MTLPTATPSLDAMLSTALTFDDVLLVPRYSDVPGLTVLMASFGIELMLECVSVISDQPSLPTLSACQARNTVWRTLPSAHLSSGGTSQEVAQGDVGDGGVGVGADGLGRCRGRGQ